MKKILVICLALVMIFSMSSVVFADGFESSPSGRPAPELIYGENESEDCEAKLKITAYLDKDELPEEVCEALEEAYRMIASASDLSELNATLKTIAARLGISTSDLAVSDLFDISAFGCDNHEGHGHFDVTIKPENLKNFVCLLHYYNGVWRIVDNATVTNNGTHIEFDEMEFSPFAIVVSTAELGGNGSVNEGTGTGSGTGAGTGSADDKDAPSTGDQNDITLYAVIFAVTLTAAVVLIIFVFRKSRKSNG